MLPFRSKSSDDFQTPPEALSPLYPYLKEHPDWIIWEPACGKGNLVEALKRNHHQYKVIGTDIKNSDVEPPDFDFLNYTPSRFDCIVTNPPYSLKQQFLERCYELGKPFALLMPITALESAKRQKLYRTHGLEMILLPKRIHFETPTGKGKSSWFATAWFTHGLNIGHNLTFSE